MTSLVLSLISLLVILEMLNSASSPGGSFPFGETGIILSPDGSRDPPVPPDGRARGQAQGWRGRAPVARAAAAPVDGGSRPPRLAMLTDRPASGQEREGDVEHEEGGEVDH